MILNNIIKKILIAIFSLFIFSTNSTAQDKNILAYKDRGIKYYPRYVSKGHVKYGKASWYGKQFHRRLTASGERYNMYSMTAAHRTYAMNTILKVTNLENHKSVRVRVNDRGPFYRSRDVDLSYGAAKRIGLTQQGVAKVKIEVVSSPKRGQKHKKTYKSKYKKVYKVQVASFFDRKFAYNYRKKHKLKNAKIVKKYIAKTNKTAYKIIVKCNKWEAHKLIKSKKFNGAYLVS
ncbi:MAG: septal ring lytic transglycosylase RlpA family protein [Sulfurovaceae bacterium]|nr:septal ring lytic transglycosylase RlpA family protein [Sulfurovaceae bacterium]